MADDDELLDDDGEASEGGGSEAPLIEEEPPVKCEECAPCKGGAPAWMATFADMATLLMAFFVLILSFAEMNVPKYKQITGSLKAAFGVQRLIPIVEPPKARSMIAREFSPAEAKPTPQQTVKQDTTDTMKREVELQTETKTRCAQDPLPRKVHPFDHPPREAAHDRRNRREADRRPARAGAADHRVRQRSGPDGPR